MIHKTHLFRLHRPVNLLEFYFNELNSTCLKNVTCTPISMASHLYVYIVKEYSSLELLHLIGLGYHHVLLFDC